MDGRLREILGFLLAAVLGVAATFLITWPMVQHSNEAVMGAGELGGWLWRYDWHFRSLEALSESDLNPLSAWRNFVALGRYPETGNILDVLAFSYPLQHWFGFPYSYNIKIFLILSMNGVCGYALGRYFSGSISAAAAASVLAVVNPLTIQEVEACGLRQALLWWVMLYPPLLDRALRRRTLGAGMLAGACLALASAFYWFYGLFTVIFSMVWVAKHVVVEWERLDRRGTLRGLVGVGLGMVLLVGPFILPYALPESSSQGHSSGLAALPEMSFFLPFPSYDTISHAPLRPSSYAENVHASLHRTIGSSWSASYPVDPTLNEALPLTVLLLGLIPALLRRRSWGWLLIWGFFYLGSLGPFLRIGSGDTENVTRVMEEYVVRLPYVWMFQLVPGMSRMFAPYRLGSYVVVASVALVAIGLSRLSFRAWLLPFVVAGTVAQPLARLGRGAINEGDARLESWRSPFKMTRMSVPAFYRKELDPTAYTGIVELPLDQQQDIVCFYQTVHQQKVYLSWASPGSLPPFAREVGTAGEAGKRLRFQARPDVLDGEMPALWRNLSTAPESANVEILTTPALESWAQAGHYQWVVLHERGYLLVDTARGFFLYETAKTELSKVLGPPVETSEAVRGDPANAPFGVPTAGELIPWSSQPLRLPPNGMPDSYRMAIFKLPVEFSEYVEVADNTAGAAGTAMGAPNTVEHHEAAPGEPMPAGGSSVDGIPAAGAAPQPAPHVHVEAPPGAPRPVEAAPAPAAAPPTAPPPAPEAAPAATPDP